MPGHQYVAIGRRPYGPYTYNTGTSTYVTLEDLAEMVKSENDFVVYEARTGEDITRSVLTQIIFEQEGKGQN
ncbi:MAG TPA: polyhydroxyalkanoate synthesis regulator DNA-binding domain-containing protein, partial [Phycisphaerae bacterium]|nr:polyhydroxyalkanoate synthesis regulator DNA-binding domain-containing protein [Phycisphaerae bacterium]